MPQRHAAIALYRTVMVLSTSVSARRPGQVCDAFNEIQRLEDVVPADTAVKAALAVALREALGNL